MIDKPHNSRALPVPTGRIARLGRLSAMSAGIAGNMAVNGAAQLGRGQRPSWRDLLLTPRNISRIAEDLAKMRGAAMKIGQLMSMDTGDVFPPELAEIMARLRDDAHFMPPSQLKRVLNARWPQGWLGQFSRFDVRPIAAASIGQVHRARLRDGRDLAIKVQYPGVARSIDSDVANVGTLLRMSGLVPKGIDLAHYIDQARQQLHEETDYVREATQLSKFGELLAGDPTFAVPTLHSDLSGPDIIAMSYLEGRPIEDASDEPQPVRDRIGGQIIALTLRELFDFGLMQTDPNFANYLYCRDTGQIVLLDFGATRSLGSPIQLQYKALLQAGLADDVAGLTSAIIKIGFIGADTSDRHRAQVLAMIRQIFAALNDAPQIDFADTTLSQQLQADGVALVDDGFIPAPLPFDVLLLQRKFAGVFLLAARLRARVDVRALLEAYLK